jgi:hypothetical protein
VTALQKQEANPKTPSVTLDADRNNNKVERMNGEVRDKVMRGLKNQDIPIRTGMGFPFR